MSNRTQFIAVIGMLALLFGAYLGTLGLVAYYDRKEHEKRGEPPRFDERQRTARLRAGNHALWALLLFLTAWTILNQLGYAWAQNIWAMLFCALLLTWGVWAADCILHDGLLGWKEKKNLPDTFALTYTWVLFYPMDLFRKAGVTDSWLPVLFVAVDCIAIGIAIFCKWRKEKREQQEEEAL